MRRPSVVVLCAIAAACLDAGSADAQERPTLSSSETAGGPREQEAPIIEVLTFGLGDSIFEKYGHTAACIRYHDPNLSPVCFNYGITDFDSIGGLAWNFLRGKQIFWVETSDFRPLIEQYQLEDRDIWVQTLPLSADEARRVEARLWSDVADGRRFYIYDHFTNNCTTRVRDIIDDATRGRLHRDAERPYPLAFRDLAKRGFAETPALVAATEFVLGRKLDEHPTVWQAMFHPHVFQQELAARFGARPEIVASRHGPPYVETGSNGRLGMLIVAMVFSLPLVIARWRRRFERVALVWATLYLVGWGILIYGLAILSPLGVFRWNEAVFVLTPLDVALPVLSAARRRRYAQLRVVGLLLVSALCALGWLHQPLWIPILTAITPLAWIAFSTRELWSERAPDHPRASTNSLQ